MLLRNILIGICFIEKNNINPCADISNIRRDGDIITPGCLYISLSESGRKHNLEQMRSAVQANVAFVAMCDEDPEIPSLPLVIVDDIRMAFAYVWRNFTGNPQCGMKLFAVTGTNGKTSCAYMLAHILEYCGYSPLLLGTVGCRLGKENFGATLTTPDPDVFYPLLRRARKSGADSVVFEASSHALSLRKLSGLNIDVGMFTNLTRDHIDFHKSEEEYLKAKKTLFSQSRVSVINADDSHFIDITGAAKGKVILYSASDSRVDFSAFDIRTDIFHIEFGLIHPCGKGAVYCPLVGDFQISNTLCAVAAASAVGISPKKSAAALSAFNGIPGRMETPALPCGAPHVFIDYAHTPDALEKALQTLKSKLPTGGRLFVLFGCGGERDPGKRPMMGKIASSVADYCIVTSDNNRRENPIDIIQSIVAGIEPESEYCVIISREEAIRHALSLCGENDVLLLAGKGHENYDDSCGEKHEFSEKKIISEYFREK